MRAVQGPLAVGGPPRPEDPDPAFFWFGEHDDDEPVSAKTDRDESVFEFGVLRVEDLEGVIPNSKRPGAPFLRGPVLPMDEDAFVGVLLEVHGGED